MHGAFSRFASSKSSASFSFSILKSLCLSNLKSFRDCSKLVDSVVNSKNKKTSENIIGVLFGSCFSNFGKYRLLMYMVSCLNFIIDRSKKVHQMSHSSSKFIAISASISTQINFTFIN